MTNLLVVAFTTIFVTIVVSKSVYQNEQDSEQQQYCLATDLHPDYNFSSKTPYEFVYGRNLNLDILPECKPVQIWSFNRHGTRLPDTQTLEKLKTLLPPLQEQIVNNYEVKKSYSQQNHLCEQDLQNLKEWKFIPGISDDTNGWLANQGKIDLNNIAIRTRTRFPELFMNTPYSEENFVFKYTELERIEESYKAYIRGFFGVKEASIVNGTIVDENNPLMGYYTPCKSFTNVVQEVINDPQSEPNKFPQTHEFKQMITEVSRKLGYETDLTQSQVHLMYKMCVFEKSWIVEQTSPWCAVFDEEHLDIFEYWEDLFYYYQSGYGNPLAIEMGCNAVKDMFDYFEEFVTKPREQHPKLIALFSHSPSVRMLEVALDLFRDSYPLRADNYNQVKSRWWRATDICPFAANLAGVLYQCPNDQYKVKFLLNEHDVHYPDFEKTWDWEVLYAKLKSVAMNCNFDFCNY